MDSSAIDARQGVGKTSTGRDDGRRSRRLGILQIETVRPLAAGFPAFCAGQAGYIGLPRLVLRVELAPEAEPDIEVRVLEEGASQRHPRQGPHLLRERELQVEKRLGEHHARRQPSGFSVQFFGGADLSVASNSASNVW
ncbi:hypothetical protein [Sorangium sp. So ce363]|uniref:hypothetical protein n=1 Tax=Sorangium sp. So ce363 TaxID=3133304 RepID=UPI003F6192A9